MPAVIPKPFTTWPLALLGLALVVFAVVGLSGPGRIDIVDGQTRFEVGRSLVEHGDSALRDARIWWGSFPGRNGLQHTYYRLPQSLTAAAAILLADATGPVSEGRRHFFFVLGGACFAAALAVAYAIGFRRLGQSPRSAVAWAFAGIFCTPNWYYATSSFDDILGSFAVVAATVTGLLFRKRLPILGAILAGGWMGFAFNCKQPLGAFVLIVLAIHDDATVARRLRLLRAGLIVAGMLGGIAVQELYDSYKFPFDKRTVHAELLRQYYPVYAFRPLTAFLCLSISPGCGAIWYSPTLILSVVGVARLWNRGARSLARATLASSVVFVGFLCLVSFFAGDPAWGPRYFTPWFGVLWLFAPMGAAGLSRVLVVVVLSLGMLVQMLALSVDPHRLYIEHGLSSAFGAEKPLLYFQPGLSHLVQRPREIADILWDPGTPSEFTPAPSPTFAFPVIDPPDLPVTGPTAVQRYGTLRTFRPWWCSYRLLRGEERPMPIAATFAWLMAVGVLGIGTLIVSRPFAVSPPKGT